ncbi:hypothetical protein B0A55_07601 [Friedmanniomyces simplex]|uniref:DNA recombination and repair protein Rad51-like C-terminal domain-containing protein n=1 Tax=Friedmanniomyces simplex TaxID=329884 RepID=A0A4V5NGK0_9PEZI|nr:hypothetical protein B0A55_07601 [Friedmanniomyces simplex]
MTPAPAEPILASTLWRLHRADQEAPPSNPASRPNKLPTGLRGLDGALQGGFDYSGISCISAEPNSGARDIILAALVSHLLHAPSATAAVIDTTLSFDLRRLHGKLARALRLRGRDAREAMAVLERLQIMKVFDFVGLAESVVEVREGLERGGTASPALGTEQVAPRGTIGDSEDEDEDEMLDAPPTRPSKPTSPAPQEIPNDTPTPALLIIDSLSQLAAPLIKSNHIQGQALLTSLLRSLSHLTQTHHHLCTLLLNGTTTYPPAKLEEPPSIFSSCALHPALGRTFAYLLDVHLLVHAVPKTAGDARRVYDGGKLEGGKDERCAEVVEVVEVLLDRGGGRVGKWTGFVVDADGELADVH